jgi:dynein heavy chain
MKNSIYAVPHKDEMIELLKILTAMKTTYEKWQEAQKFWSTLKIIFNNSLLQTLLQTDYDRFGEHERDIVMIGKNALKNNNAFYNLYIQQNRVEIFEKSINEFTLVQKSVEDYVEARRLAFPRFFFMNDI